MINIKVLTFYFLVGGTVLLGCDKPAKETSSYSESISINKCWFKSEESWPDTECGVLTVQEDYGKLDGRTVKLPFIIIKAENPSNKTYPLVVAGGGGPGGAIGISEANEDTFDLTIWTNWYSSTIEAGRDLILIDNRGVGSSIPRLNCYEAIKAEMETLDELVEVNENVNLIKEVLGACRQRFVEQGIDVSQYQVINAARDLEELRIGLGIKQLNVYGISYGTRVSLVYERLYPDSVRSMILDGVFPQVTRHFEDMPRQNYEAVKQVIKKCQEDSECMGEFGFNLEERLSDFLEQLDKNPITVSITSPEDYEPIDVIVTADVFFDSMYAMMYDEYAIAFLPKYLYSAFRGNTDFLTEMVRVYYVNSIVIDPVDAGAYASYACFDDLPFADYPAARKAIKKYPFQHYSNKYFVEAIKTICEVWDVPVVSVGFKEPYKIDTPVLIYSGELDPATPAALAKPVIDSATISWEMVWPNVAHGVMFASKCADWVAEAFLGDPESDPNVYECFDKPNKLDFVIR
ncbi:MAG: hypothetical protein COC14_00145 [Burkholderiaceae bacterium]|nr:MAG: hypothetical protein COC14_00145 [Burkholderiaceae bacterium]